MNFVKRILAIYLPYRWAILGIFSLLFAAQAAGLIMTYCFGRVVDALVARHFDTANNLALLILAIFVGQNLCGFIREKLELIYTDFTIPREVSRKTMAKLMEFSLGQLQSENSGIKQSVIGKGQANLVRLAHTMLYQIVPVLMELFLISIGLLYLSFQLGLVVLTGITLYLTLTINFNWRMRGRYREREEIDQESSRQHTELLRNLDLTQINAQEKRMVQRDDERLANLYRYSKNIWDRLVNFAYARALLIGLTTYGVTRLGNYYVSHGLYSPGQIVIFLSWTSGALGRLGVVGSLQRALVEMISSIGQYFTLIDVAPDVPLAAAPIFHSRFAGRIEFRSVSFRYPVRRYLPENHQSANGNAVVHKPHALKNVSFTIAPGEKVAIVGPSGAGKSTIVHLLLRGQDPDQGEVMIDDFPLTRLDLPNLRRAIGYVEQSVNLFDETLRFNLTFGLEDEVTAESESALLAAVQLARLDKLYRQLEKGLDTYLGERGIKLSGGERQRVGIARALIKQPDILIFDEATSSLDPENEEYIRQAIDEISHGRTTIIIAHRLSTIRSAKRIIVLDEGRIVGDGVHRDLAKSCPTYQRLIKRQVDVLN